MPQLIRTGKIIYNVKTSRIIHSTIDGSIDYDWFDLIPSIESSYWSLWSNDNQARE